MRAGPCPRSPCAMTNYSAAARPKIRFLSGALLRALRAGLGDGDGFLEIGITDADLLHDHVALGIRESRVRVPLQDEILHDRGQRVGIDVFDRRIGLGEAGADWSFITGV